MTCQPNWFHGSCFIVALAYLARTKNYVPLDFLRAHYNIKVSANWQMFRASFNFVQNPMAAYIAFKTADLREITLEYISRLVIHTKVCRNIYLVYTF